MTKKNTGRKGRFRGTLRAVQMAVLHDLHPGQHWDAHRLAYHMDRETYRGPHGQQWVGAVGRALNTLAKEGVVQRGAHRGEFVIPEPREDKASERTDRKSLRDNSNTQKKMRKIARLEEGQIYIDFEFDWELVDLVKSIPGRQFIKGGKYWTAPLSIYALETLQGAGFQLDENLLEYMDSTEDSDSDSDSGSDSDRLAIGDMLEVVGFFEDGAVMLRDEDGVLMDADMYDWEKVREGQE